jgi:hypothetical protein
MILPLAEIAQLLRQRVSQFIYEAERRLLLMIMNDEVAWLTGDRYARRPDRELRRWGRTHGSVVVHAQKLRIHRPRVRGQRGEMKLGSYELFRQEEAMQRQVWDRIMRGLTMRGYGPAIRGSSGTLGGFWIGRSRAPDSSHCGVPSLIALLDGDGRTAHGKTSAA